MATFTEAIKTTAELLQRVESQPVNPELQESFVALLGSVEGARGFFVSLLTGNSALADHPEPWLFQVLRSNEEIVSELLIKNLVMSTATDITHTRDGNSEAAQGSQQVARRTKTLIAGFQCARVQEVAEAMRSAIDRTISGDGSSNSDRFASFLQRWNYDAEQLAAARRALAELF